MNRIGLKDYLLNEASDSDLLDCAKAYDTANQYGHFDTYDSVEEAAKLCGWDVETALSESRHVESDADCYRFNGYGHLEAVSNESLLEDARDNIDVSSCLSMRKTRLRSSTRWTVPPITMAMTSRSI